MYAHVTLQLGHKNWHCQVKSERLSSCVNYRTLPNQCLPKRPTLMMKYCFTSTETVGVLGTEAQDIHLDFHTAAELCPTCRVSSSL